MKKLACFLALVCAASLAFSAEEAASEQTAVAEEKSSLPISLYFTLATDSRYICDGQIANPDPVASITAGVAAFGFYADIWAQYDMTDWNGRKHSTEEVDYTIGYNYTFDSELSPITIGAKWQYYQYPDAFDPWGYSDNKLIKLSASLDDILADETMTLGFGAELAYRYSKHDHYFYGNLWGKFGIQFTEKFSADATLTGYIAGNKWFNRTANGTAFRLNTLELKAACHYAISDYVTVNAYIATSKMMNSYTRKFAKYTVDHYMNWWCGASIDFNF